MPYHIKHIPKGELGEFSKIMEEVLELGDAIDQNNKVMALVELSDLIGAIELYALKQFNGSVSLDDLLRMKETTQRVFRDGTRR